MSLFDIIRYGNTNLSNPGELRNLPEALFDLYWSKSIYGQNPVISKANKISHVSSWAIWNNSSQIQYFKEALKEYSNESI